MKNLISRLTELPQKSFFKTWVAFHAAILTAFLISAAFGAASGKPFFSISADLFSLVPQTEDGRTVAAADAALSENVGRLAFVLAANADFEKAKDAATELRERLLKTGYFESTDFGVSPDAFSELSDHFRKHRWNLLDAQSADAIIAEGGAEEFCEDALSRAFGAFNLLPMDDLASDPFMLAEIELEHVLAALQSVGIAMSPQDGVLECEKDGEHFVLVKAKLTKRGAAMAVREDGIDAIYRECGRLSVGGTRFVFSGVPFHVHESSKSAASEIAVITAFSIFAVLAILIFTFRSLKPIALSAMSIVVSLAAALLASFAAFRQIHAVTLLFGTSIIGCGIDYCIHFFVRWSGDAISISSQEIRNRVMPGAVMSVASSCISFAILSFAPFAVLHQISFFCVTGLASAFLSSVAILPAANRPNRQRNVKFAFPHVNPKAKAAFAICVAFAFAASLFFRKERLVQNNVANLYKMSENLLQNEGEAAEILQSGSAGYFIICGDSAEEALENEEKLRTALDDEGIGYICSSIFSPSVDSQKKSRVACKSLLENLDVQISALGFGGDEAKRVSDDFAASEDDFVFPQDLPSAVAEYVNAAWLGEIEGQFCCTLTPSKIESREAMKKIAQRFDDVFFFNKSSDVNDGLDSLTREMMRLLLVAFASIFVVLRMKYCWKDVFKIALVPLTMVFAIAGLFSAAGMRLEFFSVTGMTLVFGLGIDYVIYMVENKNGGFSDGIESHAVLLSFLTTAISFGVLAASSFPPVRLLGTSILVGLSAAFLCTI